LLNKEQAIEQFIQLRKADRDSRAWRDAWWAMAQVYNTGPQWGYLRNNDNALQVQYLQHITDPQRSDIRVAINLINPACVQIASKLCPSRIEGYHNPSSGSIESRMVADTADKFMQAHLRKISALHVLRSKRNDQCVLGTSVIRRTIQGRPRGEINGQQVRDFSVGWALCKPWEFIRDPSATTTDPARHEFIFAQELPRPVQWLKTNFGIEIKTQNTMGKLLEYHRQLQAATGQGLDRGAKDSTMPAVLVQECYFQDPDMPTDWPWVLLTWSDPSQGIDKLNPIGQGLYPNPFHGLPFHLFNYDTSELQSPWARGVPHIACQQQDVFNLGATWLVRILMQGAGKWSVEKGTVDNPKKQLNNRVDEIIEWDRRQAAFPNLAGPPTRVGAPQVSPGVIDIINTAPGWIFDSLNLADVQRGIAVKRGESAEAYKTRLGEANSVLETVRRDDELTLQELIFSTTIDMLDPNRIRMDQLAETLGPDVARDRIMSLVRQPISKSISEFVVLPGTVRPKTPLETMDQFSSLVAGQVIESHDAQREMFLQGNVSVNTMLSEAFKKQRAEIAIMKSGQNVMPFMGDHHAYHIETCQLFINSSEFLSLDEQIQDMIQDHMVSHQQAEMEIARATSFGQPQPGQASPPAPSGEGLRGGSAPAGAAMQV